MQFFLKVVTDCNEGLKAVDELFTAMETVFQFLAFVLLIAFWIELQIGMKKGLQNLRKTRNPVIAFCVTFSLLRMIEFVFIVLAKSPNSFPAAGISMFENVALAFRVLSMAIYAFILTVAGYWGVKLLRSLRNIESKYRSSNLNSSDRKSSSVSSQEPSRSSTTSSRASDEYRTWSFKGKVSATAKSTVDLLRKRTGFTASEGSAKAGVPKKVMGMTLFMILEVVTVVIWVAFYGILFTMRGTKGSDAAKVSNPLNYLILKYFEKFCEWMTIVVLCGTMIAGSRTKTAKDAASARAEKQRKKPLGGMFASSRELTKSDDKAPDATTSTAVTVGINVEDENEEGRERTSSWNNASSFDVLGSKGKAEANAHTATLGAKSADAAQPTER